MTPHKICDPCMQDSQNNLASIRMSHVPVDKKVEGI